MKKTIYPADLRGKADFGWLNARYSFSFANYFNPNNVHFGLLRVLNDDLVKGGMGFGTHPHQNMEIISVPLQGAIAHKDSMGNASQINAGEVQVMSAGTGVEHSEFNPSDSETLNLLQIWIFPEKENVEPRYDQKNFSELLSPNKLVTVVGPKGNDFENALWIHQQAYLSLGNFEQGTNFAYTVKGRNNGVYVFLIEGEAQIDGENLNKRDAMGISETETFEVSFNQPSKILLIEVPME